jgi:hypothetical protein
MSNEFEKYGMSAKEKVIFELLEVKLDKIIHLLEKIGSVQPG